MNSIVPRILITLSLALAGLAHAALPDGQIWRHHMEHDLLPYWTQPSAIGDPVGRFPTFRCNDGGPYLPSQPCPELQSPPTWIKSELGRDYVRMQARQVYAYAMGFHLTGDVRLLRLAQAGARDIRERAVDRETGSIASWYENGRPEPAVGLRTSQDLAYAGLAFAALYYLTHDESALADLTRLKDHLFNTYRDPATGLIKWVAKDDGSGEAQRDELVASLDQLNAYLILVTPALPEGAQKEAWKRDIAALSKAIVAHYHDPRSGRFFGTRGQPNSESFDGRHNDFGHTTKAYWMLYLGAKLNHDAALMRFAVQGMRRVLALAYLPRTGSWASRVVSEHALDEGKSWWIYAELDQAQGTLALEQHDSPARLESTWRFWLDHLTDHEHGEVWGGVSPEGVPPRQGLKQHQWKNGFHSMEHAVVGYLVGQGLAHQPATLYYALPQGAPRETLHPYTFSGRAIKTSVREVEGTQIQAVSFRLDAASSRH